MATRVRKARPIIAAMRVTGQDDESMKTAVGRCIDDGEIIAMPIGEGARHYFPPWARLCGAVPTAGRSVAYSALYRGTQLPFLAQNHSVPSRRVEIRLV